MTLIVTVDNPDPGDITLPQTVTIHDSPVAVMADYPDMQKPKDGLWLLDVQLSTDSPCPVSVKVELLQDQRQIGRGYVLIADHVFTISNVPTDYYLPIDDVSMVVMGRCHLSKLKVRITPTEQCSSSSSSSASSTSSASSSSQQSSSSSTSSGSSSSSTSSISSSSASSGSSSSSSTSGIITCCCPDNAIPETLNASDGTHQITLTWDGVKWVTFADFAGIVNAQVVVECVLNDSDVCQFWLDVQAGEGPFGFMTGTCDPFSMSATGHTGSQTYTVTVWA